MSRHHTVLQSIATGQPPARFEQDRVAEFMGDVESLPDPLRRRIPQIYQFSGIDTRATCIPDFGREQEDFEFFPANARLEPAPSTAARNLRYRDAAIPLAEQVSREAIGTTGLTPDGFTHLIVVSCTGFFAPGLDIEIVKRLGMRPDTARTMIGFMGCYAALTGLRTAHAFCQSDPEARVLLVCVELCTLHFQISGSLNAAVANSLFSDGAAAVVLTSEPEGTADGRLAYVDGCSLLDDDSLADMTWDVGDTGFDIGLSSKVPAIVARNLPASMERLLGQKKLSGSDIDFWAIHPGGRLIVEKAQEVLGLENDDVHDSLDVLRRHGNMSSPTVLFVLKRFLDRHHLSRQEGARGYENGIALAFGPGLTLEACLFRQIR